MFSVCVLFQELLREFFMSFLIQNLLPRLLRLHRYYRQLIGLRRTASMIFSSVAISLLELGGFALLFPFIRLVTDADFFNELVTRFGPSIFAPLFQEQVTSVVIFGVGLAIYFVIKAVVYTILIGYQSRVAAGVQASSTKQLINATLTSRYQLFLDHGAVKIAGTAYSNTAHAALLFQSVVAAANEVIFLAIVFFAMAIAAPKVMLGVVGLLMLLAFGVFFPLTRHIARLGRETVAFDLQRSRFVYAMASAIRDIKIMGLESLFAQRNMSIVDGNAMLLATYQTISASLRVLIENLMLCAIVVTCTWFAVSSVNLMEVAPLLVTLGLITVRMAPAFSRLAACYNNFRFSLPVVETLLDMFDTISHYPQLKLEYGFDFKQDFIARGLKFGYGDQLVIDDASIEIPFGSVVAVVGASGSGKSTLLDLLMGLQKPMAGKFSIGGVEFEPFKSFDFSCNVGYVPQSIALLDASLEFNICLEDHPDPVRLEAAIQKSHLDQLIDSLPQGGKTLLGDGASGLSGGQRQRVGIARALYRNPGLLILDEVTSALDEATARAVMDDLQALRGEASLLFVTHDMHAITADFVYEMVNGRLVSRSAGN